MKLTGIVEYPKPNKYKVTKKGAYWPYRLMGKNAISGKWELIFERWDMEFISEWLKAEKGE